MSVRRQLGRLIFQFGYELDRSKSSYLLHFDLETAVGNTAKVHHTWLSVVRKLTQPPTRMARSSAIYILLRRLPKSHSSTINTMTTIPLRIVMQLRYPSYDRHAICVYSILDTVKHSVQHTTLPIQADQLLVF